MYVHIRSLVLLVFVMLGSCNIWKLTKFDFLKKNSFGLLSIKGAQNDPKMELFSILKTFFFFNFPWKWSRMKDHSIISFLAQIPSPAKFLFSSYNPECSHPIRMQDSLNCDISRKNRMIVLLFWCSQTSMNAKDWLGQFSWVLSRMLRHAQSVLK